MQANQCKHIQNIIVIIDEQYKRKKGTRIHVHKHITNEITYRKVKKQKRKQCHD